MHTLTVTATTMNGQPDTGDEVFVFSVTNTGAIGLDQANVFYHGSVKYSVPGGTYWAIGEFFQAHAIREDVLPQFSVRGTTTANMSERATTSKVGFAVPRPASPLGVALTIDRMAPGVTGGLSDTTGPGLSLWVSPVTRAPADGVLRAYTSGWLASPGDRAVPYAYSLSRADPAGLIPRDQRYIARPAGLATVRENYYQDIRPPRAAGARSAAPPQQRCRAPADQRPCSCPAARSSTSAPATGRSFTGRAGTSPAARQARSGCCTSAST